MAAEKRFTLATRLLLTHIYHSENIDEALTSGLDVILDALGAESGTIWVLNNKKDRLFPATSVGPRYIKCQHTDRYRCRRNCSFISEEHPYLTVRGQGIHLNAGRDLRYDCILTHMRSPPKQ